MGFIQCRRRCREERKGNRTSLQSFPVRSGLEGDGKERRERRKEQEGEKEEGRVAF